MSGVNCNSTFHLRSNITKWLYQVQWLACDYRLSATLLAVLLSFPSTVLSFSNRLPQSEGDLRVLNQHDVRDLTAGQAIARELAIDQSHAYRPQLKAGEFINIVIEQRGIDVAISLLEADGTKIVVIDEFPANEKETICLLAETSSEYTLEVKRLDKQATSGSYEIRIQDKRLATQRDQDAFSAQRALSDGNQLRSQGTSESLRKAIEKYQEALPLWRAVEDFAKEAATLNQVALTYSALGDPQRALQYHHLALPLRRSLGDRRGESITLNNIGSAYVSIGESKKALEFYDQALKLKQSLGDRKSEANTLYSMASAYLQLGELQKALEYFDRALQLTRVAGERLGESLTLSSIGSVYYKMGDWQKASEYNREALSIVRVVGDRRSEATMLHNIGTVYAQLGELETALEYYGQALPLRRTVGDRRGEAYTLDRMGSAYFGLSDNQRALDYYNQAIALMRVIGDKYGEAYVLSNIGAVYARRRTFEKANEYFDQSLRISQMVGDRLGEASAFRNIGSVCEGLKESSKAMENYTRALALFQDVGDRNREAATLGDIARVERDQEHLGEAVAHIESALAIVDSTRQTITNEQLRASYLTTKRDLYDLHIDVLMQMHRKHPAEGLDSIALQASERARARTLLDVLTESRADIRQGVDPQLIGEERSCRQQLNGKLERLTILLSGKHTQEQEKTVRAEVETLLRKTQEAEARIRAASPRYAALIQPRILSVKEIQQELLDDDTLLLEYALGEERSYLWVVTAESIKSFELPGRTEIDAAARRVYELLVSKSDLLDPGALTSLSQMVLEPVADELKGKRLLIVTDGALQYIPFGALPDPTVRAGAPNRRGYSSPLQRNTSAPLILNHEIVSLPSASAVAVLRRELGDRRSAPKVLAVLADPVFDKNDNRVRSATKVEHTGNREGTEKDTGKGPLPFDVERSTKDLGLNSFERLVLSRREAEVISALVHKGHPLKALDFSASRATATSSELGDYQIVHFATHSLLNNRHPELSGIVLSLVDQEGRLQDGFLRLYEIYNLKLGADLVVLSACQTAIGKDVKGEGLVGMTRGFMYAGVPRVVASLWNVSDKATSELMKRFYQNMLRDGMRPAAALRAAQVSLLKEKQWRAPYYWAAFVFQGDWK